MKNFRMKIKLRLIGSIIALIISVFWVFMIVQPEYFDGTEYSASGLLIPILYLGILSPIYIIKNIRLLKIKDEMRATFIEEEDERSILIRSKSFAGSFNICLKVLANMILLLSITSISERKTISLTLLIILLYTALVRFVVNRYYERKY
jgi:hypothetical protein